MKQPVFEGTCTALITPFAEHQINYKLFDTLLARQIQAGVSAVAVCATTGEAATMSDREQTALIAHCVTAANGACKVIAGTGTNDTVHAIEKSKAAEAAGADALLVVTPYYNKCNSDGLLRHYTALADAVHIPVILYNVPSRTGVHMTPSQYAALGEAPEYRRGQGSLPAIPPRSPGRSPCAGRISRSGPAMTIKTSPSWRWAAGA